MIEKRNGSIGLHQINSSEDEEEGVINNDRIVYKQIELCYQSVPRWGREETINEKPIWHGLRKRPYTIPRKKETFSVFISSSE